MTYLWASIWIFFTVTFSKASPGDKDIHFHNCLYKCERQPCNEPFLFERVIKWGCKGNCQYKCMFSVTEQRLQAKVNVLQYYGKWPFHRFLGIQEPASFLFSLMNLVSQIFGWIHYTKHVSKDHKYYSLNKTQFLINCSAWICAAVFHARDTYWTEKMDYFSAALVIGISLFTCCVQIIGNVQDYRTSILAVFLIFLFGGHIFYMAAVKFDYGYNMKFLVTNGVINIALWMAWCVLKKNERPFVWKCALSMGGTLFLAVLEIWDFPPIWFIFDSHSLWHLGTTPVAYLWFCFLADNAVFENKRSVKYT